MSKLHTQTGCGIKMSPRLVRVVDGQLWVPRLKAGTDCSDGRDIRSRLERRPLECPHLLLSLLEVLLIGNGVPHVGGHWRQFTLLHVWKGRSPMRDISLPQRVAQSLMLLKKHPSRAALDGDGQEYNTLHS